MKMFGGLLFLFVQLHATDSVYTFFPKEQKEVLLYQKIRYLPKDTLNKILDTLDNEFFNFTTSYDISKETLLLSIHEYGFVRSSSGVQNIDTIYLDTCSVSGASNKLECKGDVRNHPPTTLFFSISSKNLFIDPGFPLIDPHWSKFWYYDLNDSIYLYSEISNPSSHFSTADGYHTLEYCLNNIGLIYYKNTVQIVPYTEQFVLVKLNDLLFPVLDESRMINSERIDAVIPKFRSEKFKVKNSFYKYFILRQYILGRKLGIN